MQWFPKGNPFFLSGFLVARFDDRRVPWFPSSMDLTRFTITMEMKVVFQVASWIYHPFTPRKSCQYIPRYIHSMGIHLKSMYKWYDHAYPLSTMATDMHQFHPKSSCKPLASGSAIHPLPPKTAKCVDHAYTDNKTITVYDMRLMFSFNIRFRPTRVKV